MNAGSLTVRSIIGPQKRDSSKGGRMENGRARANSSEKHRDAPISGACLRFRSVTCPLLFRSSRILDSLPRYAGVLLTLRAALFYATSPIKKRNYHHGRPRFTGGNYSLLLSPGRYRRRDGTSRDYIALILTAIIETDARIFCWSTRQIRTRITRRII